MGARRFEADGQWADADAIHALGLLDQRSQLIDLLLVGFAHERGATTEEIRFHSHRARIRCRWLADSGFIEHDIIASVQFLTAAAASAASAAVAPAVDPAAAGAARCGTTARFPADTRARVASEARGPTAAAAAGSAFAAAGSAFAAAGSAFAAAGSAFAAAGSAFAARPAVATAAARG
jgi:hypothetical protein